MHCDTLAIDFGTSNSAAAVFSGNAVQRIAIEEGAETLPTAVFFPAGGTSMRIGAAASQALIDGEDGRYMRALKSVLGLPLLHEKRLIGGRNRTLAAIITDFLVAIRERAETQTGQRFARALSGRPVHFHSADAQKDAQAQVDLHACYLDAGFEEVAFLAEPEAAAMLGHRTGAETGSADDIGLIVDIGGGTSDFSVFRSTGATLDILANHGIRLGGTDFDYAVSMAHAMPLLGLDGKLRRAMGQGLLPVPRAPYVDLATWSKIPFLYTAQTRRMVADMARLAVDPQSMDRLAGVIELELGHELAFAVERAKIAVNAGGESDDGEKGRIAMGFIEPGLSQTVTPASLDAVLAGNRVLLRNAAAKTLEMAGIEHQEISRVVLVGGSSLMRFVSQEMQALCPRADLLQTTALTAVVDGLALATQR